MDLTLTTVK